MNLQKCFLRGAMGLAYLAISACIYCAAQTYVGSSPTFEVATVKPGSPDATTSNINLGPGRFSTRNITLASIVKFAYGLNSGADDQIEGAPDWIRKSSFDINAKEDEATVATIEKMTPEERMNALRSMLQALLAERFHLKVHWEMRERTVSALVQAKGSSKMMPAPDCSGSNSSEPCRGRGLRGDGRGHIEGKAATMEMLVNMLAGQRDIGGRTIVDDTGLTGKYNFDLKWTPDGTGGEDPGPSLFSGLQEQLGLKLETRKLPVRILIVDQVEQPTAN